MSKETHVKEEKYEVLVDKIQKEKTTYEPVESRFKVILKSNDSFHKNFDAVILNLYEGYILCDVRETKDFAVLNWITKLPKDEVVTLIADDPDSKILCMLRLFDLSLEHHACTFQKSEGFGQELPLLHIVKLKYRGIDRAPSPQT